MAENSEMGEDTRDRVDVPRDGFVGRVVQDPRQPPDALLLTGFVGDSAEEGHLRLYSDPSLAQYVDVPEDAVLHSEPLPMDQSPLGGSHLWVRSDAKLLPQGGGAQQQQAGFLGGQLLQEQLGAAAALGGGGLQITLLTVAGCFTRRPWQCPVKSYWIPCIPPTVVEPHCFQVEWPVRTIWEQPGGFQAQAFAAPQPPPQQAGFLGGQLLQDQLGAAAAGAGGLQPGPVTLLPLRCPVRSIWEFCPPPPIWEQVTWHFCNRGFAAAQQPVSAQCQMSYGPCPTHMPGCPSTSTCPPTDLYGCPRTSTCPPTYMPGCPSTSTCPPEAAQAFGGAQQGVQQAVSAQCRMSYGPCPSQPLLGCTGWLGCGQGAGGQQQTMATVCTQIGCQSLGIACTALSGCGCYPLTVGPVVPTHNMPICPPGGGGVVSAGRCPSAVDACPTRLCGGQFGGNPGF